MSSPVDPLAAGFTARVEPCRKRLWAFLLRLSGDRALAEDWYQETLLRAWRAMPGYREEGRFLSWLFRIAHNVVRDARRRETVRPELVAGTDLGQKAHPTAADDRLRARERQQRLIGRLATLSSEQREVFLLRMHSSMTFREIAALTEAPLSTVINRMRDALAKLAVALEED